MTAMRSLGPADGPAIAGLLRAAFPEEDLTPLVADLLPCDEVVTLGAEEEGALLGMIQFTRCRVGERQVALLGPLAVAPERQGRGLGTALIRSGKARMAETGIDSTLVLGDPGYYGRHGFAAETGISPPYPLPDDWGPAWQSIHRGEPPAGMLEVPSPWQDPALWSA